MKNLLLHTLILFLITFKASAQLITDRIDPTATGILFRNDILDKNQTAQIEGSQYIVDEFRLAEVSGISTKLMVRYNAMTDMIEVQNDKKELFSLTKKDPFNTISFVPFNTTIKLLNYKTKAGEINGYLTELFNSNNISLLRRDKVNLQKGKEALTSYSTATPTRYIKERTEYYLVLKNETAAMMPKNKSELQDLFPLKKEAISVYLKRNDFSLKKEKSIIEMVKFISNF